MRQARSWSGLLALVIAASTPTAAAGPDPGRSDRAAQATARAHFDRAQVLYSLQRFQDALDEYEAAFELSQLPGFLFNIGQCHRNLGQLDQAVLAFRRYLVLDPGARDRADVEHLIAQLEAAADEQRGRDEVAPPARAVPPASSVLAPLAPPPRAEITAAHHLDAALAPPPRARRPIYARWWFWTGIAVAAAGAVAIAAHETVPDSDLGVFDFRK